MVFKAALLVFSLCCVQLRAEDAGNVQQREDLTGQLKQILACVTGKLKDGIPSVGLPPLDPLQIDEVNLDDLGGGHVHLANITVGGILDLDVTYFSIDACDVSPLCLVADLLMNALSLTTGYDIDVTLFDTLHVFGKGDIRLKIADIAPSLTVGLSSQIESVNFDLTVGDVEFVATGLLNDDYMSKLISNMIQSIIKDHLKEIIEKVIELLGSAIANGEQARDINIDEILGALVSIVLECIDIDTAKTLQIDTLLRR